MGHLIIGQDIVHTAALIYGLIIATTTHTTPTSWQGAIKFMEDVFNSSPEWVVYFSDPPAAVVQKQSYPKCTLTYKTRLKLIWNCKATV